MKVCILQPVLDPYKGANHLPLFAALRDIEFTIVCNRSQAKAGDLPANVRVVTVPGRTGPYYYGLLDYRFASLLLKAYPEKSDFWQQFDIIHSNQTMGPALRKLRKTGVPLLFLIHHPVTADRDVSGWALKYAPLVAFQKRMCEAASHIVTVSSTMQERIATDYSVSSEKISVVYNGVDGDTFPFTAATQCEYDVIAAGSFVHPRKGFSYLTKVYRSLSKKGYSICDVGRRTSEQLAELQTIAGVHIQGMVDDKALRRFMAHSRCLISTSLFEGFGLSLIEALSCGHPAFAFNVGAVPEVLGTVDSSLIIPVRDTQAMVTSVEQYLKMSPALQDKQGQRYRSAVLEAFSLHSSAEELRAVYRQFTV